MNKIQITTTAIARPEILERTLKSFSKNLIGLNMKERRIIINIDPIPKSIDRTEVVKVAQKYCGEVIFNLPDEANFARSVKWVWDQADSEYILHLEDDWIMIKEVKIKKLLKFIGDYEQLLFRCYPQTEKKNALSPSLINKKFYKRAALHLNDHKNPEVQLRKEKIHSGSVITTDEKLIEDIGREWLKNQKNIKRSSKIKRDFFRLEEI